MRVRGNSSSPSCVKHFQQAPSKVVSILKESRPSEEICNPPAAFRASVQAGPFDKKLDRNWQVQLARPKSRPCSKPKIPSSVASSSRCKLNRWSTASLRSDSQGILLGNEEGLFEKLFCVSARLRHTHLAPVEEVVDKSFDDRIPISHVEDRC